MPFDPTLTAAATRIRRRDGAKERALPRTILEWAQRYRRLEGRSFSLERHEPLRDLYEDTHKRIVIIKPAQRGVSEYAVTMACFALDCGAEAWVPKDDDDRPLKEGLNVGYIFPVKQDLNDFSKERITALKDESLHLSQMFSGGDDDYDSLGFKKVGDSYLYLRGGNSSAGLLSFPADVMIFDEVDRLPSRSISLGRRRMNASLVGRELYISTPTFPGVGIHAEYLSSDQRIYQSQCPHCLEWVSYEFFRDVTINGELYERWRYWTPEQVERGHVLLTCPRCTRPIDDRSRCAPGRWLVQQPEVTRTHGYWIPWWPWVFVDLKRYAASAVNPDSDELTELYRSDLGLPYGAGSGAVTHEMLLQCTALWTGDKVEGGWRNTTLGADIGARIHYRIDSEAPDGTIHVRDMGTVANWTGPDSLDSLMLRYQVRMAVVDAEPEMRDSQAFCERWPGRALRAFYPTNALSTTLRGTLLHRKKDARGQPGTDLQVNRTMAMDSVYGSISNAREVWPPQLAHDDEVIEHMTSPMRVKVKADDGQERLSWVHTKPDHFFHASAYSLVARQCFPRTRQFGAAVGGERPMMAAMANQRLS